MRAFALTGKTGTGKSYRCMDIAHENNIDAIIDDGLLIFESRIIAGSSAKHEPTRMASVRRAIFADPAHAQSVKSAIKENNIHSVLVLGTSEKMVYEIANKLDLGAFEKIFKIEEIATAEEIETAAIMRSQQGKHIIPAPVFEVKKQFSGYFLKSLFPQGRRDASAEKTVMRPTYSYLGNFRISPKVFSDICQYEVSKIKDVTAIHKLKSTSDTNGYINICIEVSLTLPCDIPVTAGIIQETISKAVEDSTSIIVNHVDVFVKNLTNL
jgi:uncharacterized alkaline shock family protein YloU